MNDLRLHSRSLAAGSIHLLTILALTGGDWPQWRGPMRNGHIPDAPTLNQLPDEPKILWKIAAGEGLASPVVADGKVFLFDNQEGRETIRALNQATGAEIWRTAIDDVFKDSQGPAGPRCTPLVEGARVYAQSCRGELQCLDTRSGKKIWSVNFTTNFGAVFVGEKGTAQGASRHGNNASPVIDGPRLIALVGGTNNQGVVALDKLTGKTLWASLEDDPAYSPPVVESLTGQRQVICFLAEALVGLNPENGRELWRVPLKTRFARHVTTPIITGDLVVVSSHEFGLIGVKVSRKGEGWEAVKNWESREAAINFSSPVLADNFLYGIGPRKNLICLDPTTGKINWSQDGVIQTSADKAHAGFLVLKNSLLMLNDSGELVLFERTPKVFKEMGRVQVCGATWCNPSFSDGKLFIRDGIKGAGEARAVVIQ